MKVAIVGGGVMGEAILAGALDRGVFEPADVTVVEKVEARRTQLRAAYGIEATGDFGPMGDAGLVVLAVKPQELASVKGRVRPGAPSSRSWRGCGSRRSRPRSTTRSSCGRCRTRQPRSGRG
ncbi:NAD(P)-binding domain-containing protein [Tepidiforma flava]|uniref:NAD(P)-binding domain-containing protein n=1 Tax=Tepidiforma flava TaxID=3004094 RepID=A0ABY7M9Z4_9CHLR|nr:NAD(P)-binding domain-containing protein [Tepidiforma flava]WBL36408.1 NAD(P)-binding domain-containing protein [Tepidiforma flava]